MLLSFLMYLLQTPCQSGQHCVHSSFAIILKRKRKLVALLLLSYRCIVTTNVLWLFLITVPWVGLQCVIVVFLDHTHLSSAVADIQQQHMKEELSYFILLRFRPL